MILPRLSLLFLCSIFFFSHAHAALSPKVNVGIDLLFLEENIEKLKGKRIGIITNQTSVSSKVQPSVDILRSHATKGQYTIAALFSPEHGLTGTAYASESVDDSKTLDGIPIFSLHGKTRRPTSDMLKNIDLIVYDIQDLGTRSYTYCTTLFYVMEEAAKHNIEVLVLDRPNPINGLTIDGPMLDESLRSMVGYINVPYCHGMTIAELARFFNSEYKIGCNLSFIPMKGWNRKMSFADTGLPWVPTSPHIPESSTPLYYPTTGILGELSFVSIGIGYTLPFKVVGAPWIDASLFAKHLNAQKFPGVHFEPFHYRPFYGKFMQEDCHGILIMVTNPLTFKPVSTQYLIIGILKSLYPEKFKEAFDVSGSQKEMFHKVNGTKEIYHLLRSTPFVVWALRAFHEKEREAFRQQRKKYLIDTYLQ